MGRPSRYPDEFRHEAVQMALATNESMASVARRLGVNETTLRNWVANELRMEKEILRKAAAYFAQETIRSAASDSSPIIDTPTASSGYVESSRFPGRASTPSSPDRPRRGKPSTRS